jgi:hypothetical protein
MPLRPATKRRALILAAFGAYFVGLWLLWYTPVVYPLKLFVVLLHEISHGLMAIATGGEIQRIVVTAREGGFCQCPGGNAFLTLSAGYLGSLGWGALIFWGAFRKASWARWLIALVGALVLGFTLLYVRNAFGVAFGTSFGVALVLAGRYLAPRSNALGLGVLGLTSVLYAVLDIKSDILDRPALPSDAAMLADLTGVPTLVWGLLWIGVALGASWGLLRWAYRRA